MKVGAAFSDKEKEKVISAYAKAISLADSSGFMDDSVASVKEFVSRNEYYRGSTANAIDLALSALKYYRAGNNDKGTVRMLTLTGDILRGNNLYDQSYVYLNEAKKMVYQLNDSVLLASVLNRLAAIYYEDLRIPRDTTEKYALASLQIARRLKLKSLIYNNLNILGVLETTWKNYYKSLGYLEEALPLTEETFPEDEPLILINIARNYKFLNEKSRSEEMYLKALKSAQDYSIPQYIRLSCMELEEVYLQKGDYKNAHKYVDLYHQSKEAILTQKVLVQLQDFNGKLAAEKQSAENQRLLYEQKLHKKQLHNHLVIGILLMILLVCAAIFLAYQNRQRTKIHRIAGKLEQSNKILKRFITILGHDLRSPFNAILGFSDLLKNEPDLTGVERKKYIDMLSSVSQSTYKLLERILEWSQLQSGSVKPVKSRCDLIEITTEVIEVLKPVAQLKNIDIRLNSTGPAFIMADTDMITTAIRNIISNAVKFTHAGGWVEVVIKQDHKEIRIEIRDNGIGIAPENIGKLFRLDENYRSHGTGGEQGTGLGLILCKEYIQMHGGEITVESEPGKGSTFIITLPV